MRMHKKPANNNFLGNTSIGAILRIIGEDDRWQVVGECMDTPNAIANELEDPKYKGMSIWILTPFSNRYYGLVK